MLICLLVVNIYLLSLKINISSSITFERSSKSCIALCNHITTICFSITSILKIPVVLKSGDIEINSGPKISSNIKFYHWNLKRLAAHDFVKVPLIEAFFPEHKFDIVCLFKIFLDLIILMEILTYRLVIIKS